MLTPSSTISLAAQRDQASSADLEATYAEKRGVLVCTPIELTLMMWPPSFLPLDRLRIAGSRLRINLSDPK